MSSCLDTREVHERMCSPVVVRRSEVASIEPDPQKQYLQFSEADAPWQRTPQWAEFLINCGFQWGEGGLGKRRIGIISMPCESAAAGLVALGAMRRRLALDDANDCLSHFQRIERLAMQVDEEIFLRHDGYKGRFRLEPKDDKGWVWVRQDTAGTSIGSRRNGPLRMVILPSRANEWRFDGEAPTQQVQGVELPCHRFYEVLVDGASAPIPSNFSKSDSGICIAGRVAGESISQTCFAAIRFKTGTEEADLTRLLTVQRWSPGTISRVAFFNTRTGQFDRNTGLTRLVVADGDGTFLRLVGAAEFKHSDLLGVIHRAVERDRLEAIGVKLNELAQWYTPDTDLITRLAPPPKGITISSLRQR